MFDDTDDFNYNENRESDDPQYEDDENEDIELNRDFDNMNNYEEWGWL